MAATSCPLIARLIVLLACLAALPASAGKVAEIETEHVRAEIVLRSAQVAPGESTDVALVHSLADGWHTYWLNPGDSGEPPVVDWTLEGGGSAGPLRFPVPSRIPYPPLMNHGYKGDFTLLSSLTVPADWPAGEPYPVTVRIDWLVCEAICIPEGGEAQFVISTGAVSEPDPAVAFTFVQAEWALPQESDAAATYTRDDATIYLSVPLGEPEGAAFFAVDRDALDHAADQSAVAASDGEGMTLALAAGRGSLDGTLRGVLKSEAGAWWIEATGEPDPVPLAAAATPAPSPPTPILAAPDLLDLSPTSPGPLQALAFAFLGGLILNLMPCVFPVLALKALGLIAHAGAPLAKRAVIGGAYAAGILVSFSVLAAVLLGMKAAGASVGWGFQLQSPAFVILIALVLFTVGLSLSGLFTVGAGLTRLGGVGQEGGTAGSFATGALATVVATPCSAPFMAVAIGTALAASPLVALAVFTALALGFATPFVLICLLPGLTRAMPRPGVWMERLKQALAFPLYATAAWLVWVLAQLAGIDALLPALAAFILVALAAWLYGLSQRGSGASHRVAAGLAVASIAGAGIAAIPAATGSAPGPVSPAFADSLAQPYSPARLEAARAEGDVFVNVTAAWCITCKVNERVVLAGDDFPILLERYDVTYLEADWTRRDPEVSAFMERFGRAGVPLYVHYPVGGAGEVLPQILTASMLEDAFAR